jgi:hypothetical protein
MTKKYVDGVLQDLNAEEEAQLVKDNTITNEQYLDMARNKRIRLFEEADIEIYKLEDSGGDVSAWRTYRQALRDITKQSDPSNLTWPTKPS